MTDRWKTVRVFISSTFRDMQAERDYLVKVVFPGLRERLLPHHVHLVDIDLRWGVTQEQAENDRVLDLCLSQIGECHPFFIGLLGERYGWVPARVSAAALRQYGWLRSQQGKSLTELEIMHGILGDPEGREYASFYFRAADCLGSVPEELRQEVFEDTDPVLRSRLITLKEWIRASGCAVYEYRARWDPAAADPSRRARGRMSGLESFAATVSNHLWRAMRLRLGLPEQADASAGDPLVSERACHEQFSEARRLVYVPRKRIESALLDYIDGDDSKALLVSGPAGSGKSTALAWLVTQRMGRFDLVVEHFAGASPASTSLRAALLRMCSEIDAAFGSPEQNTPPPGEQEGQSAGDKKEAAAPQDAVVELQRRLGALPRGARLALLMDGLNQFEELQSLSFAGWLPRDLPPNVKWVLSCDDEGDGRPAILSALRARCGSEVRTGALTQAERKRIVAAVPSLSAKTLDPRQRDLLVGHPEAANALYLLVALEELRTFGSFERLTERIEALPRGPDATVALFRQVFERLGQDFDRALVETVLCALLTARHGLTERDLAELVSGLAAHEGLYPVLRQMRSYLLRHGDRLAYFHSVVAEAVRAHYFQDPEQERVWHKRLADYFEREGASSLPALAELPWQRTKARDHAGLERVLTSLEWLEAKAAAGLVSDLLGDLRRAAAALPRGQARTVHFRIAAGAIGEYLAFLELHPSALFQCLWNCGWWYDAPGAAEHYESSAGDIGEMLEPRFSTLLESWREEVERRRPGRVWLRSLRPPALPPSGAQLLRLRHDSAVLGVSWPESQAQLVAVSARGTIRAWDPVTGEDLISVPSPQQRTYEWGAVSGDMRWLAGARDMWGGGLDILQVGDEQPRFHLLPEAQDPSKRRYDIQELAFSPDGRRLAVAAGEDGAEDRVVRVWDVERGVEALRLEGHFRSAWSVAWSPRGDRIATGSADRTVRVWDAATGQPLACLKGLWRTVIHVGFLQDGKQVWGCDREPMMLVWDVDSGEVLHTLNDQLGRVTAMEQSTGGRVLAAGSYGELLLLDPEEWRIVNRFSGHTRSIRRIVFSNAGDRILTTAGDEVRVWDPLVSDRPRSARLRTSSLFSASMAPDGPLTVTAHSGGPDFWTVRLMDALGREKVSSNVATRVEHTPLRTGFSPGGRWFYCCDGRRRIGPPIGIPEEVDRYRLRVWNSATGGLLLGQSGKWESSEPLWAFSADGQRLADSRDGAAIQVWDLSSGSFLKWIRTGDDAVHTLILSSDGRWLAGAGGSGWWARPVEGDACGRMNDRPLHALCFSPSGEFLAGCDAWGYFWLWELASGRSIRCEEVREALGDQSCHPDRIPAMVISADGKRLFATWGQVTVTWDCRTGELVDCLTSRTHLRTADGDSNPWRASSNRSETCLTPARSEREIAWYPAELSELEVGPGGLTFLATSHEAGGYVAWLAVEGDPREARPEESPMRARLRERRSARLPEVVRALETASVATGRPLSAWEMNLATARITRDLLQSRGATAAGRSGPGCMGALRQLVDDSQMSQAAANFLVACAEARLRMVVVGPEREAGLKFAEALVDEAQTSAPRELEEVVSELAEEQRTREQASPAPPGFAHCTNTDPQGFLTVVDKARKILDLTAVTIVYGGSDPRELRNLLTMGREFPGDGLIIVLDCRDLVSEPPAHGLQIKEALDTLGWRVEDSLSGTGLISFSTLVPESIDLAVELGVAQSGRRIVARITEVCRKVKGERLQLCDLFSYDSERARLCFSGVRPHFHDRLMRAPHGQFIRDLSTD